MNYNKRRFRPVQTSEAGETTEDTVFEYRQEGHILSAEYSGGGVAKGHLLGLVDEAGNIEMRYHQINAGGELKTGVCSSTPELMANGKIRLHEKWRWTSGDGSSGTSVLEEE